MAANDPSADLDYLDEYDPARGIPFSSHLLAGSVAGLAEHLLVFPLDTLKTNAQCVGACGRAQGPDVLCLRAAKRLAADGIQTGSGARRLFRGVGAVTVACVPAHAMYRRRRGYSADGSRRRRGWDVDIPRTDRGDAAAGTWRFRGDEWDEGTVRSRRG